MAKDSLRGQYGKTLLKLGRDNKNIFVMDADLAKSTKTSTFAAELSDRFIDMGLSEGDMISTAAGIALTGKTVFASSFCVFLTGRTYDQIRQSVCYNNANVKLAGTHSGLGVGEDGATHQALEDIAMMRAMPGISVLSPADAVETEQAIEYAVNTYGPFYIRLTRHDLPKIYDDSYKFEFGKASVLQDGSDITLVGTGATLHYAVEAAELLKKDGISAAVINISTILPLDTETIIEYSKKTGHFVTIEDHSIYGGLGGAVAECLSQHQPAKLKVMGMTDFGRSGKPDALYSHYGLNGKTMAEEALKILGK